MRKYKSDFRRNQSYCNKILQTFYYNDLGKQGFWQHKQQRFQHKQQLDYFQANNSYSFKAIHIYKVKMFQISYSKSADQSDVCKDAF